MAKWVEACRPHSDGGISHLLSKPLMLFADTLPAPPLPSMFSRPRRGRYVNDNVDPSRLNCKFEKVPARGKAFVVSTRELRAGEELFLSYGRGHWISAGLPAFLGLELRSTTSSSSSSSSSEVKDGISGGAGGGAGGRAGGDKGDTGDNGRKGGDEGGGGGATTACEYGERASPPSVLYVTAPLPRREVLCVYSSRTLDVGVNYEGKVAFASGRDALDCNALLRPNPIVPDTTMVVARRALQPGEMIRLPPHDRIEAKPSTLTHAGAGMGAFARVDVKRGTVLGEYVGGLVCESECCTC